MRSTKRQPASLRQPNERRRHNTAGRKARSAALLVGSTPGTRTNVQSAGSKACNSRQTAAVLAQPHTLPRANRSRSQGRCSSGKKRARKGEQEKGTRIVS